MGGHNLLLLDMEFMKKFQIGSGLQNFHIHTPLTCS